MEISVATSWDDKLIDGVSEIKGRNEVYEFFGSLKKGPVGSLRPVWTLPEVGEEDAREHIDHCHSHGYKFNYTLNALCLGNKEYNRTYRNKIIKFVDKLVGWGVDAFTVSNPFLVELIRREYEDIEIVTSSINEINDEGRALFYEGLGVSRITFHFGINRRFDLIKRLRESVRCDLEMMTNLLCLKNCPMYTYHGCLEGHSTSPDYQSEERHDFPPLKCHQKRLSEPVEMIKSPWVRPEDLKIYEKFGIKFAKIAGRNMPTEWILERVKAYMLGKYDGNLYELVRFGVLEAIKEGYGLEELEIWIDNNQLEGFLDFFVSNCRDECGSCNYCDSVAKRVLSLNGDVEQYIKKMEEIIDSYYETGKI